MKQFCLLIMAFLLMSVAEAWAETDFVCLKACTHNSGNTSTCLGKCSYSNLPPVVGGAQYKCFTKCLKDGGTTAACVPQCAQGAAPVVSKAKEYNPNPLDLLKPYDTFLLPPAPKRPAPELDSACMRSCLKEHYQYGLCSQTCAK